MLISLSLFFHQSHPSRFDNVDYVVDDFGWYVNPSFLRLFSARLTLLLFPCFLPRSPCTFFLFPSSLSIFLPPPTLWPATLLRSPGSAPYSHTIKHFPAISNRVRALHPFIPTEPGELGFNAGDVIIVVDRGYKDWWRGQLRGRTGEFTLFSPFSYLFLFFFFLSCYVFEVWV